MRRALLLTALIAVAGCSVFHKNDQPPYENPFYAKYLTTGSALDAQINRTLAALRADATQPQLHNELGALLVQKGFPKDAEAEFERAINLDGHYYQAWYNLGLVRASHGDEAGARRAFQRTIHYKPGHAMALFNLGLIEEKLLHTDRAIDYYAKAFHINPRLLQVDANPRILDSALVDMALLRMYTVEHAAESMQFQGGGAPRPKRPIEAPSPQAAPSQIIPPAPPATDPSMQPAKPPK